MRREEHSWPGSFIQLGYSELRYQLLTEHLTNYPSFLIQAAIMPSVTSLDKDLRNMRLSKYTPEAAADIRDWIEEALEEKLPSEDVLGALKDGVALCKYV